MDCKSLFFGIVQCTAILDPIYDNVPTRWRSEKLLKEKSYMYSLQPHYFCPITPKYLLILL